MNVYALKPSTYVAYMKSASTNTVSTIILLVNSIEDVEQGWKLKT